MMRQWRSWVLFLGLFAMGVPLCRPLPAQSRYATSDNWSGYVHWIDLYDQNNTRIDPRADNPRPYSPEKTCGRCHDYDLITAGWHFNAVDPASRHGRPGQPWIWSDDRTGTHLPLSYREYPGTFDPDAIGLSRWEVAAKLGGYLPGGGPGSEASLAEETSPAPAAEQRADITGPLPVDCMLCHRNSGSGYSPFAWTEQIDDQNFAYAPTVAMGLATIRGSLERLPEDFDLESEEAAARLPKLAYDLSRFRNDGKVFFDLVRTPKDDACYYCHSNVAAAAVGGDRWLHDEDVHLRAGIACADCHRNGLGHHTVRGYPGERHPHSESVAAFSCQGCHVGAEENTAGRLSAGMLGAPKPIHRGLPPLHFEKLSCTACHSGPRSESGLTRQLNSIAHRLGEHVRRTGDEYPGIVASLQLPVTRPALPAAESETNGPDHVSDAGPYTPHRLMWPSFWGIVNDGEVTVLHPEEAYQLTRRALRVRGDFTESLADVRLPSSKRRELLGEERARTREEEWTDEERAKIAAAEAILREEQVTERLVAALSAIEESYPSGKAIYVSGGVGFVRQGESQLEPVAADQLGSVAEPYRWPLAHNVRPARQSLGATGCTECHRDDSPFFTAEVTPVALLPDQQVTSEVAHRLQGADIERLWYWNTLFSGRSLFKVIGLILLVLTGFVAVTAFVSSFGSRRDASPHTGT